MLGLLLGNSDQSYYLRQIASAVGIKPGTIAPELALMTNLGILTSHRVGNQVFFRANEQSPIFTELKQLVAKTVGVIQLLRTGLESIADKVEFAFIYGSFAKREETALSDVDLMLIGNVELEDVLAALQGVEKQVQRQINPTLYSPDEFRAKLASGNHFLTSVLRGPKILIMGEEDELGGFGREQEVEARGNKSRRSQKSH